MAVLSRGLGLRPFQSAAVLIVHRITYVLKKNLQDRYSKKNDILLINVNVAEIKIFLNF